MDVHKTICTVDIAGYGGMDRTRPNYVALRSGMFESVQLAFDQAGIPWDTCFQQDVGDCILLLVHADVPKGAFAGELPRALAAALCAHNEVHPPKERVKLRLALHAGEVTYDKYGGVAGKSIILASRLLDAPPLKEVLRDSPGSLAMIASDWFYTEVIQHDDDYEPDAYRRVSVAVKEFSDVGWIRTPGHELPALPPPLPPSPPSSSPSVRPDDALVETVVVPVRLRPASPEFYEVVDALEDIPCMRREDTRLLVVDELRFAGTVRHFPSRRAHVISILRTCLDFDDGVLELVSVISNHEAGGSVPLKRLLTLLTGGAV